MSDRGTGNAPIRHLSYTAALGTGPYFGDHYVIQDTALYPDLAEQFTVTVHTRGDKSLPGTDPMSRTPHVETQVFNGSTWETRGRAPIGKDQP